MAKKSREKSPCGCDGKPGPGSGQTPPTGPQANRQTSGGQLGKRYVRPLPTPKTAFRTHLHKRAEAMNEVRVIRPGGIPVRVVVPESEATPELVRELEKQVRDLPRLHPKPEEGAVDIALEDLDGGRVKGGIVVLEGPGGTVPIPIDAVTRRFRKSGLAPGEYQVRASSTAGRGFSKMQVRKGDVSRLALRLDGSVPKGSAVVRLGLKNVKGNTVKIRATERTSGRVVFNDTVTLEAGIVDIKDVPFGRIHWDIDDGSATSCYDSDVNDLTPFLDLEFIELKPVVEIWPDPPDPRFKDLPFQYRELGQVLPALGIRSMEELAAAEPEMLMHRAMAIEYKGISPVHNRLFATAVEAARSALGATRSAGQHRTTTRLPAGSTFSRSFIPRTEGEVEIRVDLGPGGRGELRIQGPSGLETRSISGAERIRLTATPEDIASSKGYELTLINGSSTAVTAVIDARLPVDRLTPGFVVEPPSVKGMIENILQSLAVTNPGLSASVPDAIVAPENIQMWIDRAKTFMYNAGVCSMNDLGRLRAVPMPVLQPGAYVAPVVQPPSVLTAPPLVHYLLAEVVANSVLHYTPNDLLHDSAVVLAGEWDIRGQTVIIGKEVRELVVIVGSILHDAASRITWETSDLPAANSYWPNPAPSGQNGQSAGESGQDGADGDANPHPAKNGGTDAVTAAPTVTMYILDATNNLPPIDLRGQDGGAGGNGQDGGRGGDGARGLRADGTFFGGCCRGVGFGGNGGQGGDGGRGGKGGRGGQGGRITVLTTPPGISTLSTAPPAIDVNRGMGGPGGPPGNPASGGAGGPAGTADCEMWCDEHPERRGTDGTAGAPGQTGFTGDPGPVVVEDAIQFLPITDEQWQQEFNQPHILDVNPDDAEPGQTVTVIGQNFDTSIDRVYFDGVNVGAVSTGTQATFVVPTDSEGGYHPVVIRPSGVTGRRSNRVLLRVLPKLDDIAAGTRWLENQSITLTGLAFRPGLQVLAEDRSVTPAGSFSLPVVGVTRTSINIQVPGGFLGGLRGVRRIVVRNPDGGSTRDERVVRISDTIVVRCAAFRVVGTTPGVGTSRSETDIANLFLEGVVNTVSIPWAQARIVFRLVQPVQTITVADNIATVWPIIDNATDTTTFNNAPGVLGTLNFFFIRDVELATAYAYFGGGPLFIGDEGSTVLGPVDFQQVVAHEIGHSLCLRHICDGAGEGPGTFFNRDCEDGDEAFLMYPFWDTADGMAIPAGQVDAARVGATHFEDGKTASLPAASLFQLTEANPQCQNADTAN